MSAPPMGKRARCARAHFVQRCAERGIPADPERLSALIWKMAPCWRREGGPKRYKLRVKFNGAMAFVIWDDELGVPVTAWWPWNEPDNPALEEIAP